MTLTRRQLSLFLGISLRTVERWCRASDPPPFVEPHSRHHAGLYDPAAVLRWLAARPWMYDCYRQANAPLKYRGRTIVTQAELDDATRKARAG